jgi:hypothetical protein
MQQSKLAPWDNQTHVMRPFRHRRSIVRELRPHIPTGRGRFAAEHFDKDGNPSKRCSKPNQNASKTGTPCRAGGFGFGDTPLRPDAELRKGAGLEEICGANLSRLSRA